MLESNLRVLSALEIDFVGGAGDEYVDPNAEIVVVAPMSKKVIEELERSAEWNVFWGLTIADVALSKFSPASATGFGIGTGNPVSAEALKNQMWDGLIEMHRNDGTAPDGNGVYIPGGAIPQR